MMTLTALTNSLADEAAPAGVPVRRPAKRAVRETPMAAHATLVLWTGCLAVGVLGLGLPYARPLPAVRSEPPPVQAELVQVELTADPVAHPEDFSPPPPDPFSPPPLPSAVVPPAAPALVAVADPGPAVAFALPVDAPSRVVPVGQAAASVPVVSTQPNSVSVAAPAPQPLQYGRGDGRQPAPDYPAAARRSGQEGTVKVEFTVGEDGRVLAAEVASASPWPLLNDSAVHAVRNRWRFREGPLRRFVVEIVFQLRK